MTKDGRRISNISVIVKKCDHVNCVQVVQEQIGAARICVVRDCGYTEQDEQELLHQFRLKMGDELDLEVEYLDEPIRTQSGKRLSIISKVKHG